MKLCENLTSVIKFEGEGRYSPVTLFPSYFTRRQYFDFVSGLLSEDCLFISVELDFRELCRNWATA